MEERPQFAEHEIEIDRNVNQARTTRLNRHLFVLLIRFSVVLSTVWIVHYTCIHVFNICKQHAYVTCSLSIIYCREQQEKTDIIDTEAERESERTNTT